MLKQNKDAVFIREIDKMTGCFLFIIMNIESLTTLDRHDIVR